MTEREYQTHDTAMLSLTKIGFEQRKTGPTTEKKAEPSGWSDVTAIDSTLCFWATHEAVRIMKKYHMENFGGQGPSASGRQTMMAPWCFG